VNIVRRIIDILAERIVPLVGSAIASRLEALVALEHAEHQNELEDRARQFEDEDKPHLAAALRSRASQINPESPASQGLTMIRRLHEDQSELSTPLLERTSSADSHMPDNSAALVQPARKRSSPRRNRRSQPEE
jgi:DNA-binding ferritin-like protein